MSSVYILSTECEQCQLSTACQSQTDVLIVDVFLCLPTFQILCLLVLPNYKTHRPPGAEQSSEIFYYRHHI